MIDTRAARLLLTTLLSLTVALSATGCRTTGAGGDSGGSSGGSDGVLRVGTRNILDLVNPFSATNHQSFNAFHLMYPTLVAYDANGELVGDWAESWATSPNGKVWTFTLRQGEWSDGEPLTAEDAAWTGNTIIERAEGSAALMSGAVEHVVNFEAADPQTLVVTYDRPVANVLDLLTLLWVLPKHVWQPHEANLKSFRPAAELPVVGAGPYILTKHDQRGLSVFERNPTYYGAAQPNVKTIGIQFFTNADTLVQAFQNGDVDYLDDRSPPVNALEALKEAGGVLVRAPGPQQPVLGNNSNPQKVKNKELQDRRVRQAFDHALNREEIVEVVFNGYAQPAASIVAPNAGSWQNPSIQPASFDLAEANRILDEAGYQRGGDGIRVAPDGSQMAYEVKTAGDSAYNMNRLFEIVQADFREIGVNLTQRVLDEATMVEELLAPDGEYLDSDLYIWDYDGFFDPDFILSIATTAQYGGWNETGYSNPVYDKLYKRQSTTLDTDVRRQLVWRMQEILNRDKPYHWLVTIEHLSVHKSNWTGFQPALESRSKFAWTGIQQGR
jgi:peptide/nickel transport system substrate-binding protein